MNDQGLDKLFKDRLEGIEEHPPVAAWDRLDSQLQGRKQKAWWQFARVAAVLAIIACSVILFNKGYLKKQEDAQIGQQVEAADTQDKQQDQLQDQPNEETLIADNAEDNKGNVSNKSRENNSDSDRSEKTSTGSSDTQQSRKPVNTQTTSPQKSPAKKEAPLKGNPQQSTEKPASQIKLMQSPQTQVLAEDKSVQSIEDPSLKGVAQLEEQEREQDINQQSEEQTSMDLAKPRKVKITYKKSPSPPEPTLALVDEPQEKTSAVKRLWIKAQSLKNGQVGLAKIRSAKDQLLVIGKKKKEKEVKSN